MGIQTSDGKQSTLLNEINITPFVDVVLVLMVIFMITAPMIGRGVEVDLPRTRAAIMEVDQSKLLLVINERREVFIGTEKVPHDRLEVVLRTNERLQREREIFLQADRDVPYGFVVHIMAILREAGIDQLGLVTDPLETEGELTFGAETPIDSATTSEGGTEIESGGADEPSGEASTSTPDEAVEQTSGESAEPPSEGSGEEGS